MDKVLFEENCVNRRRFTGHPLHGQGDLAYSKAVALPSEPDDRRLAKTHHEEPEAPHQKADTGQAAEPWAGHENPLDQHEGHEERDPKCVHDPDDKEYKHGGPATAHAVGTMMQAGQQSPNRTVTPMMQQKPERRLAMNEAGLLEGSELIEPGADQDHPAERHILLP